MVNSMVMRKFIITSLIAALLFISCNKSDDNQGSVTGTNRIIVTVIHHTYVVPNMRIFLKNNATEYPGSDTTLYNWKTSSDASGTAIFNNLFEGNYFLYATGFDQQIGLNVIGASPVVLNSSTLSNNELYITLNVTE